MEKSEKDYLINSLRALVIDENCHILSKHYKCLSDQRAAFLYIIHMQTLQLNAIIDSLNE